MNLPQILEQCGIPAKVIKNAIAAVANGVAGVIKAGLDVPKAYLERLSDIARAETEGKVTVIHAAAAVAVERLKVDGPLADRALEYFGSKIVREQQNRESVASRFLTVLKEAPPKEDASALIDDDWLTIFWRLAETKSSSDVQELLVKLLMSEVTSPNSVSPTTLQTLSVLTSDLGKTFERVSRLSIDDGKSTYVIHPNVFPFQNIGPLDDYGVSYEDLLELDGVGLIRSAETSTFNFAESRDHKPEIVDFAGVRATIDLAGTQVQVLQFTRAGKELRRLIALQPVRAYTKRLKELIGDAFVLLNESD
jgi:hypothetical protein